MKESAFYVYVYLDPRKAGKYCYKNLSFLYEPIYVGKGRNKRYLDHLRCLDKKIGKINIFKNKLHEIATLFSKQEIQHYILLKNNLTEQQAFNLEMELIKQIGRIDLKAGPLTNLTNGGDGASGAIRSKEMKIKYSESKKGKNNPNFGKFFSEAFKKKMSESRKGEKNPMFGKTFSEESRKKISEANKGEKHPMFGKHWSKESNQKRSKAHKGKMCGQDNPMFYRTGEKHPNVKLAENKVHQIHMLIKLGFFDKDIAHLYKVSGATIFHIKKGNTWKHVIKFFTNKGDTNERINQSSEKGKGWKRNS